MAYDINRFKKAQKYDYEQALSEMKAGRKRSHLSSMHEKVRWTFSV